MPDYLVGFSKRQLTFLLNALDFYGNHMRGESPLLGDCRERIVLARYGKIRKTEMPAIRAGRRTPTAYKRTSYPKGDAQPNSNTRGISV